MATIASIAALRTVDIRRLRLIACLLGPDLRGRYVKTRWPKLGERRLPVASHACLSSRLQDLERSIVTYRRYKCPPCKKAQPVALTGPAIAGGTLTGPPATRPRSIEARLTITPGGRPAHNELSARLVSQFEISTRSRFRNGGFSNG